MKKVLKKGTWLLTIAMLVPMFTKAQETKVETSVGADIVSNYIWRGQDLGNVSIQPSLSVNYGGLSLGAWGSVGIDSEDTKEFDFTLTYSTHGLTLGITDYWFTSKNSPAQYFHYGAHNTAHVYEANIGYDFGPLILNWYTNFAGNDGVKADGDRAYSSFINLSVPFKLGGLDWSAEIGATPWETNFYNGGANGFEVSNIGIGASKEVKITDTFSVPAYGKITFNPATEGAYFVFGITL